MKSLQQNMHPCCQSRLKHVAVVSPSAAHARKPKLCRWAPDRRDEGVDSSSAESSSSSSKDIKQSRRLINQLLQIQSLSSLQSIDISPADELDHTAAHLGESSKQHEGEVLSTLLSPAVTDQTLQSSSSSSSAQAANSSAAPVATGSSSGARSGSYTLFDDPASEDYDPMVLDLLGFTAVAEYLDNKLALAAGDAKVSLAAVAIWCLMAAAMIVPLGGVDTYTDSLAILTDGGLDMGNLYFLWVSILTYYSAKGCFMALAMSYRSWRLHEEQGEALEELASTVELHSQRRAFWKLQEKLQNADDKAKRTYAEFALSSLLLGVLMLMKGGTDNVELQMETLDQEAYLKLVVVLWLFWEAYFATVGSVVKVSNWASAVLAKWQYTHKWGAKAKQGKQ